MPIQTFVTHFRALDPAYTLTQQQTLAWLVEAQVLQSGSQLRNPSETRISGHIAPSSVTG